MSDSSTSALCSAKPVLLLLEHDFEDPKHAGRRFFCRHGWVAGSCVAGHRGSARPGWRCAGSASRGRVAVWSAWSAKVTKRCPRW
ncbi:DUF3088 domain-containing protein [Xanthomonas arboricola pv. corylina]|uniref:DUF3088 domain-containing protein n=1 Tax=Xanthomonas arboricola TaxID=56448 RepID=UPI001F194744|nr:DUF3088 domain-containing protein [Xanthomonas arboricola]MDN0203090.1 DUF3088 domain-containing protein [Xanthomonas arboricola pv. corylina]MDN0207407.1 DUF3088 domain-containing protein [Xanthomonas arboricola pv. corylina]MDN0211515.1 DUF3088 domain-containing protein [Xanthomonas arboricola pv. corylina]MDN0215967.1 DUF3088 domain-containing protein [Xanthomonas arboricola pv. corylina]